MNFNNIFNTHFKSYKQHQFDHLTIKKIKKVR